MPFPVGVAFDVEGIPELRRAFKRAAEQGIPLSLKKVNHGIGEKVIKRTKPKLPVVAGDYAASLRAGNTSWHAVVRAGYRVRAPHAPIIHWGSAYRPSNPPRPHLAETAVEMVPELERDYIDGLSRELNKLSA